MDDASLSCKIKLSKKINKKAPVFLSTFTNGRLNINDPRSLNFQCYRSITDRNVENGKAHRILAAESERLSYVSVPSESSPEEQNTPLRYFVGVRKRGTSKMKLYDATLFSLKPILMNKAEPVGPTPERSYRESVDHLTADFGSKSKKRAMVARLKYSVDSSLTEALEDLPLTDSVLNTSNGNLSQSADSTVDYIPPQNKFTSEPCEVYDINDIITPEECEALISEAEMLIAEKSDKLQEWRQSNTYCKYLISHLENQEVDLDKAVLLLYYNYLSSFHKLKYADVRRKDPAPMIPEPFKSKLLKLFTLVSMNESKRSLRTMPQKMKDKLLAYLIVLALFIDNFSVNLTLIQSDLNVAITKLVAVSQAVGCHISTRQVQDSSVKFAELKLPLFILTPKHSKRKF